MQRLEAVKREMQALAAERAGLRMPIVFSGALPPLMQLVRTGALRGVALFTNRHLCSFIYLLIQLSHTNVARHVCKYTRSLA